MKWRGGIGAQGGQTADFLYFGATKRLSSMSWECATSVSGGRTKYTLDRLPRYSSKCCTGKLLWRLHQNLGLGYSLLCQMASAHSSGSATGTRSSSESGACCVRTVFPNCFHPSLLAGERYKWGQHHINAFTRYGSGVTLGLWGCEIKSGSICWPTHQLS